MLQLTEIRGVLEDAGLLPKTDEAGREPAFLTYILIFLLIFLNFT